LKTLGWFGWAWVLLSGILFAQESSRRIWFRVEEARQAYEYWASEWERAQELYRQGLISEQDLRRTEREFRRAALVYQEARLEAQGAVLRVRVERALKYLDRDDRIRVRLLLRRDAADIGGPIDLPTGPIYVSLLNPDGTAIARPYEHRLGSLPPGSQAVLEFVLLEDRDTVRVRVAEGGQVYEWPILLERGGRPDPLALTAEPFSQVADLGTQAAYRLKLEYFGKSQEIYQFRVTGLPPGFAYDLQDAETQARLTQVRLAPTTRTLPLVLVVYLPERLPDPVSIGQPLPFEVELVPSAASGSKSGVRVRLELIPRGVGRLQVRTVNLYEETRPGREVTQVWTVTNTGEGTLDRVTLRVEPPWQWEVLRSPEAVPHLAPGEKADFRVILRPPSEVAVGDYEATVWAEAWTGTRPTRSDSLRMRVHVGAPGSIVGTVALLGSLVLLLAGIVFVGLRLMRR
jgi:hypothetical protein